jgi:hypothetical protein
MGDSSFFLAISQSEVIERKETHPKLLSLTNFSPLWIFESDFIDGLPWDPEEWHWQASSHMGDSSFFWLFYKARLSSARKPIQSVNICSFIQRLNL